MASIFAGIEDLPVSCGSTGVDVGLGLGGIALFGEAVVAGGSTVAVGGKLFGRVEPLEMVISKRLEKTAAIRTMDNPIAIG